MPFLKRIVLDWDRLEESEKRGFPFDLPAIRSLSELDFPSNVTYFVGDNGSGKSTLLEAIGAACGFSVVGGKDLVIGKEKDDLSLSSILKLIWQPKVTSGFYFRAETFDTFAAYIDELSKEPFGSRAYEPYGGKSLNERSHGQGFLTFFENRMTGRGLYVLDEPESALSPQNQLAFMRIIWELASVDRGQFIIATHSPILLSFPGARLLHFTDRSVADIEYEQTEHYRLTRDFLNNRERYFRLLFEE
ncbi:AAA family ATPase [Paenibacillus oceani]|uniref:AAA family ATPase n=1 Tax=Paenibacillus oceani TaxID=2772510 RepID=A0A927CGW2_9BACL|nr:AAA family ATPase [Paenibacillus oceani]MBD2866757.1 AAA family ATPase [Paenibacillus oceani]